MIVLKEILKTLRGYNPKIKLTSNSVNIGTKELFFGNSLTSSKIESFVQSELEHTYSSTPDRNYVVNNEGFSNQRLGLNNQPVTTNIQRQSNYRVRGSWCNRIRKAATGDILRIYFKLNYPLPNLKVHIRGCYNCSQIIQRNLDRGFKLMLKNTRDESSGDISYYLAFETRR